MEWLGYWEMEKALHCLMIGSQVLQIHWGIKQIVHQACSWRYIKHQIELLNVLFPEETVKHINSIYIPRTPKKDTIVWKGERNEKYSEKSGYILEVNLVS